MKKGIICTLMCLAAFAHPAAAKDTDDDGLSFFKERVKTLGSDEFGGRKPLTPYETKTIHYIADEFRKLGLQPANGDSYFQEVREIATMTRPKNNRITVKGSKGKTDLRFGNDVVIWTNRGTEKIVIPTTDLVFVGFGIHAPEYGWDDYKDIDVKGKIVIAMVNDPGFYDPQLFRGKNMTYYGRWTYKHEEAERQGAAGVLVLHNKAAASYGWEVCMSSHVQKNIGLCDETLNANAIGLKGWLAEEACRRIFAASGTDFEAALAAAKRPGFKSIALNAKSKVELNVQYETGLSHNVAAVLPGTDLQHQYIVCTAHWDHFGIGTPVNGDSIYNGASDNASGVAALMWLARKYQQLPVRPRRSLVFVAVTSEECGLLGSQHYCEHPLFPLEQTALNLNFDGCAPAARTHDVNLRAAGKTNLDALVVAMASAQGRRVNILTEDPAGGFFRSDHFNFVKKGVPTVLAGGGKDYVDKARQEAKPKVYRYHQPNDEYDESWWDFDGTMENLNLMFGIGLAVANADGMPVWLPGADFQRP